MLSQLEVEQAEKLELQKEVHRLRLREGEGRDDGGQQDDDDLVLATAGGQPAATVEVDLDEELVLAGGGSGPPSPERIGLQAKDVQGWQAEDTDAEFLEVEQEAIAAAEQAALQAEAEAIAIAYAAAAAADADHASPPPPSSNAPPSAGGGATGSPPPLLGELSLERWLEELCVERYAEGLREHGVISVTSMAEMSADDLTGLLTACAVKKGHQKKISKALALALAAHDEQEEVAAPSTGDDQSAGESLPELAPRDIRRLNWQLEGAQRELDELVSTHVVFSTT